MSYPSTPLVCSAQSSRGEAFVWERRSRFPNPDIKCSPRQRGIILIALLWVLTALSLLALNLAGTVKTEVNVAQASGEAEKAYFYARGALEEALYRIVFPDKDQEKQKSFFPYGGGMNHYWMSNEESLCHVAIFDEAGKVDLNFAKEEALKKLLENLGVKDPVNSSLAKAIVEWREPNPPSHLKAKEAQDSSLATDYKVKHRPFTSVEELLLLKGMSREILYGVPQRKEDGKILLKRGLAEYVTVYSGKSQININYAEAEVIAAVSGLDLESAQSIVQAREKEPFTTSSELSQRMKGLIQGETLSLITTQLSPRYCVVATAFLKGSKVRRSLKVVAGRDDTLKSRHKKLIWYDEYWPLDRVLATQGDQQLPDNALSVIRGINSREEL